MTAAAVPNAAIGFAFDFASTASLLAFQPTCQLADELGIDIDWLPFPAESRATPKARPDESVGERHARVRAEYAAMDFARYASVQGIEVNRDAAGVDSRLACAGCLQARRANAGRGYVERLLFAFWAGRVDIESPAAIAAVLAEVGADGLDGMDVEGELQAHRLSLEARGVFNVPTYLVADQLFIGRQHLPMIRALLNAAD